MTSFDDDSDSVLLSKRCSKFRWWWHSMLLPFAVEDVLVVAFYAATVRSWKSFGGGIL